MTTKTSAKVIDGKPMAKQIRQEAAGEIARMKDTIGVVSGLVVILVGSRKDSQTYVRNRKKSCEDVGITSFEVHLPEDSTKEEVLKHISGFNNDLSRGNATISIVHSYTKKPEEITRQADIVISAAGVANLVTGSWIKPGAVIINVGMNPVDDPECPRGYRPVMSVTKRPAW